MDIKNNNKEPIKEIKEIEEIDDIKQIFNNIHHSIDELKRTIAKYHTPKI